VARCPATDRRGGTSPTYREPWEAGHALGFVNPAIYQIARGPLYHQAFHAITTGDNTVAPASTSPPVSGYQAVPGWDPVTGWGTPDARILIPLLARWGTAR
jgi:subtilase family serine protease